MSKISRPNVYLFISNVLYEVGLVQTRAQKMADLILIIAKIIKTKSKSKVRRESFFLIRQKINKIR